MARGDLIIGTSGYAAHTQDGVSFTGYSALNFGALRAGYAALWAPNLPVDIDHGKR